jgi:hypothetical protein
MAISLSLNSLQSRVESRTREAKKKAVQLARQGGIIKKISRFLGFAFGAVVKFFNLSFDRIWDILVDAYFELKTFDWNATDEELDKLIETNNQRIITAGAAALGNYLGWGAFRIATFFAGKVGLARAKRRAAVDGFKVPVISGRVGLALAEEGQEELMFNFRRFVTTTISAQLSNAFINFVLTSRRNEWFGQQSITSPQTNGSIAAKIDSQIQRLPKFWQRPVETLIDEFEDGIIEAGYVVAMTIDDYVAANRYSRKEAGPYRTLEIQPEKGSDEKIAFKGSQLEIVEAVRTVLPVRQLVADRDVGQILGEPVNETIHTKPQLRTLHVKFYGKQEPPYIKNRKRLCGEATIQVPDARPGLDRKKILSTVRPYQRGNWFVKCQMDNGREMKGWFQSKSEGIEVLTTLAGLSTADIEPNTFRWSEGQGDPKKAERMYAGYASITSPKRRPGRRTGEHGKAARIPLWGEGEENLP